jgi:hypothetical protein
MIVNHSGGGGGGGGETRFNMREGAEYSQVIPKLLIHSVCHKQLDLLCDCSWNNKQNISYF